MRNYPLRRANLVACGALVALLASTATAQSPRRMLCGCPDFASQRGNFFFGSPTDCDYSVNTADAQYDPTQLIEIPVVVAGDYTCERLR